MKTHKALVSRTYLERWSMCGAAVSLQSSQACWASWLGIMHVESGLSHLDKPWELTGYAPRDLPHGFTTSIEKQ